MLFGDAPRMSDVTLASHGNITVSRKQTATENHLGPGAYFTAHNENIRGGWIKRSFSTRQPMGPTTRKHDRGASYTHGVMQDDVYYERGSHFSKYLIQLTLIIILFLVNHTALNTYTCTKLTFCFFKSLSINRYSWPWCLSSYRNVLRPESQWR